MILDSFFQRVVIISLDTDSGRKRAARTVDELSEKGLTESAIITRAIDGKALSPPAWWTAGSGAWGCMQSHYRAIQDAYSDGIEKLLIIEDDAIWQNGAADLVQEFLLQLPEDWGQVYFGGQHRSTTRPKWLRDRPAVVEPYSVHRTHCYGIHRNVMVKVLQHIIHAPDYIAAAEKGKNLHVDHQLEEAHKRGDWKIYAPSFWIVGQGENRSSINGKHWPSQWWHLPWRDSHARLPLIVIDRDLRPDEIARLHIGNHPKEEADTIDEGIEGASTPEKLLAVVNVISLEAFKMQRIPAIHNFTDKVAWLHDAGKTLIRLSEDPDLAALVDFPRSRLIEHPWLNPDSSKDALDDDATQSEAEQFRLDDRKLVHQIWIGDDEMPARLAGYCETVKSAFPGWSYKLWKDDDLPFLAENAVLPEIVLGGGYPIGIRADVIRLEILRQYGGVYFDVDFECLKQGISRVVDLVNGFGYGDEMPGRPSNAFMCASGAWNPFVEFYLRRIGATVEIPEDVMKTVCITGPDRLAECLNAWVGDWRKHHPVEFSEKRFGSHYAGGSITGFWREFFYPYGYEDGTYATFDPQKHPDAYAAHHWEGSWHRDSK